MAHILPASQSTIEHRMADRESDFSKAYERGRSLLNGSLRRKQIQVAMSGNVTMLIWLGKQHLGQTDRRDLLHGSSDDLPVRFTLDIGRPGSDELPHDEDGDDDL